MCYKYAKYITLVPLVCLLLLTRLIVLCTHCSPVLVVIICVFVFLFLGGFDISIQLLLPDPFCIFLEVKQMKLQFQNESQALPDWIILIIFHHQYTISFMS